MVTPVSGNKILKEIKPYCGFLLGVRLCRLFSALVAFSLFFFGLATIKPLPGLEYFGSGLFGLAMITFFIGLARRPESPRSFEGLLAGLAAGVIAAFIGGTAYYGVDPQQCATNDASWKLVRLLVACPPMGGLLGWIIGLTLPLASVRPKPIAARTPIGGSPSEVQAEWVVWLLGSLGALIGMLFFYVSLWTNLNGYTGFLGPDQSNIIFWQYLVIIGCFAVAFVTVVVRYFGWAPAPALAAWPRERRRPILATACWAIASGVVLWLVFPSVDIATRDAAHAVAARCRLIAYGVSTGADVTLRIMVLFAWLWSTIALGLIDGLAFIGHVVMRRRQ